MIKTGTWLHKLRKKENLTQSEVASKLHLDRKELGYIEAGIYIGSVATWRKINRYYKTTSTNTCDVSKLIINIKDQRTIYGEDASCYLVYNIKGDAIVFNNCFLQQDFVHNQILQENVTIKLPLVQALEYLEYQQSCNRKA